MNHLSKKYPEMESFSNYFEEKNQSNIQKQIYLFKICQCHIL